MVASNLVNLRVEIPMICLRIEGEDQEIAEELLTALKFTLVLLSKTSLLEHSASTALTDNCISSLLATTIT